VPASVDTRERSKSSDPTRGLSRAEETSGRSIPARRPNLEKEGRKQGSCGERDELAEPPRGRVGEGGKGGGVVACL
jgi:hypothetical protein